MMADKIDRVLARHYGCKAAESDFILNCKYRPAVTSAMRIDDFIW
jgi:hypothetical protein